jgi:hypothetical protein
MNRYTIVKLIAFNFKFIHAPMENTSVDDVHADILRCGQRISSYIGGVLAQLDAFSSIV